MADPILRDCAASFFLVAVLVIFSMGASTASPMNRDSDGGGGSDRREDVDRNGPTDAGETDPLNIASDTIGMPDDWAFWYELDPLSDGAGLDPDSDGYTHLAEYLHNTVPSTKRARRLTPMIWTILLNENSNAPAGQRNQEFHWFGGKLRYHKY